MFNALTQRQQAVFFLVAEGLTNEQIALRLGLTLYRVKVERAALVQRMGALSRAAIAGQAERLRAALHGQSGGSSGQGEGLASSSPLHQDDFFGILEIRELPQLLSATNRLVNALGFESFGFIARVSDGPGNEEQRLVCFGTYPESWLERYRSENYDHVDPVVRHCEKHRYPLAWTNQLFQASPESMNFYEEARAFGVSAGGACPLPDKAITYGGLGFTRDQDADAALWDVQRVLPRMHMLSSYLFETLQHFLPTAPSSLPYPVEGRQRLTDQERECLLRAASGLSDTQIADQLKLTRRTVHFHLANVRRKLGAASRAQMIAKAILQGLISI